MVFNKGLEVDKANIKVIEKLPPLTNIKKVKSFLGHASFYRRFIKYFSKIEKPLLNLLTKDASFDFNSKCVIVFSKLKEALVSISLV